MARYVAKNIVAAGIASLFGSKLIARGEPGGEYITPLVFTIVLGTVLLNATTARHFAKLVGVFLKKSEGILIIGASNASRLIGQYLQANNRHVVLIDNNQTNIEKAKKIGLEAFTTNIYSDTLTDNIELNDVGYLIAMTANSDINKYAIEKFRDQFGENGSFRIVDSDEMNDPQNINRQNLFSYTDDFIKLMDAVRKNPLIQEYDLEDQEQFNKMLEIAKAGEIREGYKLVYLGKSLDGKSDQKTAQDEEGG